MKSPTNFGGANAVEFSSHRFILPFSPKRITINAPFANENSGFSSGTFADGSQSVASINHSNAAGSIKGSSVAGKIIQWRSNTDTDLLTASVTSVDNFSFTLSTTGSLASSPNYALNVFVEE